MKKIITLFSILLLAFSLSGCDSFFEVKLDDQATLEGVFSQTTTTHNFLSNLYSYLPLDEEPVGSEGWVVARSDEAMFSWYQWVYYIPYRTGNYSSATPTSTQYYNFWEKNYIAINECSIFIANVDRDLEDTEQLRSCMKAEARFLRAFYYYCLFRQYGPVYLWGDKQSVEDIDGATDRKSTRLNSSHL